MALTPRPKNDAQVNFRLPTDAKEDLIAAANRRDPERGHNWLARSIVLQWLAREKARRRHRK